MGAQSNGSLERMEGWIHELTRKDIGRKLFVHGKEAFVVQDAEGRPSLVQRSYKLMAKGGTLVTITRFTVCEDAPLAPCFLGSTNYRNTGSSRDYSPEDLPLPGQDSWDHYNNQLSEQTTKR